MPEISDQDLSLLEKFKAKAQEFRDAYTALMSRQSYVAQRPELKAEFDALYSRGSTIKRTIEALTRTVDQITGFFSQAWSGASGAVKQFFGLNGARPAASLGLVQLLPIAAIAGAVALMGKWVSDVYLFERKVTEQKRLEGTGLAPHQASEIVRGMSAGSGFLGILDGFKMPLLLVGGGFIFLKFILPEILKRRG
jgi:hypothetical protein